MHGAAVFFRCLSEVGQTVLTALGGWGRSSEWAAAARLLPAGAQHSAWPPCVLGGAEARPASLFPNSALEGPLGFGFSVLCILILRWLGDGAGFGLTLGAKS